MSNRVTDAYPAEAKAVEKALVALTNAAVMAERKRCHDIALAIDSGRGNEKEIAKAIMEQKP